MITAQDVYAESVRDLPPPERLRLAAMILQDLLPPTTSAVDESDSWSDQDVSDLNAYALSHLAAVDPEGADLV